MLKNQRKDTYQSRSQSSQKRVCPITPSFRFPLQAGGTEPTRSTRFPSRSGGNLKEGGNCKLCPRDWYKRAGVGAFKAQGLTISKKCDIIGIAVRWRERVAETQPKEDER
jgi:hypothetical protein